MEALQRQQAARLAQGVGPVAPPRLPLPQPPLLDTRTLQAPEGALGVIGAEEEEEAEEDEEGEAPLAEEEAAEESHPGAQCPDSSSSQPPGIQAHEWTYEEQFKQVGTLFLPLPGWPFLPLAKVVHTSPPPSAGCENRDLER